MPSQTYTIVLTIEAVRGLDTTNLCKEENTAKFRVVWQGFKTKGQTVALAPDADGTVAFKHENIIRSFTPAEVEKLNLALFLYSSGSDYQNIGLATVDMPELVTNPDQVHKFKMVVNKMSAVEMEFTVTCNPEGEQPQAQQPQPHAQPVSAETKEREEKEEEKEEIKKDLEKKAESKSEDKAEAEKPKEEKPKTEEPQVVDPKPPANPTPAAVARDQGSLTATQQEKPQEVKKEEQEKAPPAEAEQQQAHPPPYPQEQPSAASQKMTCNDLRKWVADIMTEVYDGTQHVEDMERFRVQGDKIGTRMVDSDATDNVFVDKLDLSVLDTPTDGQVSLAQMLQIGVCAPQAEENATRLPTVAVGELLLSAPLSAYFKVADTASPIARALRQETGSAVAKLLKLPSDMLKRSFTDNCSCTLAVLSEMQHVAFKHRFQTGAVPRLLVYVNKETFDEWVDDEIVKEAAHRLPLMSLIPIDVGPDGSMDLMKLEQEINSNDRATTCSVGVVGRIGNEGETGCDDVAAVLSICKRHGLWLHTEGPAVVLMSSPQFAPGKALKEGMTKDINVSITVCEDEVHGLRKLPGFWLMSGGPHGSLPAPSDSFPEKDVFSAPFFLPTYLRLRGPGLTRAAQFIERSLSICSSLTAILNDINDSSHWPAGSNTNVVAKLHTHKNNMRSIRFTLMPSDHPLFLGSIESVKGTLTSNQISIERINVLNRTLFDMLKDREVFRLQEASGLLHWRWDCATNFTENTEGILQRFKELVLKDGQSMINVAQHADKVTAALSNVPGLSVVRARPDKLPMELCAVQLVPDFCKNKDISAEDLKDLNEINETLLVKVKAQQTPGVAFEGATDATGRKLVLCCLAGLLDDPQIQRAQAAFTDVASAMLKDDPLIKRLESEVLIKGIAVAEKQLQEAQAASQNSALLLRGIPLVGGMWSWLAPAPEQSEEGLQFDLNTSTLRKETTRSKATPPTPVLQKENSTK